MAIINGNEYRIPHLDIFQEFALASTLSPILAIMSLQADRDKLERGFPKSFTALIANMPREGKDEVLKTALTGIKRKDGAGWALILVNGRIMYQDIDVRTSLKLIWELIIQHKMIDFFAEDPSNSTEPLDASAESSGSDMTTTG